MISGARAATAFRTLRLCVYAVIGSPRLRRALPPRAATIRMASSSDGGDEDRLDAVHPVLDLVEND
jgi:hypothetical protein